MKIGLNLLKGGSPVGIAMTVLTCVGAVVGAVNDMNKTKKMDELIKKVEELTNK